MDAPESRHRPGGLAVPYQPLARRDFVMQATAVRSHHLRVLQRCLFNGAEFHGDVKPVENAACRPGGAIDCFFKLSCAVGKNRHPLIRSNTAFSQKSVQPCGSRWHLVVNISVEPRVATFKAGSACHQVHMACLMPRRIAVPQPARVNGQRGKSWMSVRRCQYRATLQTWVVPGQSAQQLVPELRLRRAHGVSHY